VQTDDRKAIGVGLVLWLLAFAGVALSASPDEGTIRTLIIGVAFGVIALAYTVIRSRRAK